MKKFSATLMSAAFVAAGLGGCSSDGGLFGGAMTTQSIGTTPQGTAVAAGPRSDPACHALQQRIDTLRADGLTERLEKAAAGKSATVSVKRASLAQAAELDKANAEFQARCSTLGARPMQAAAPTAPGGAPAPIVNSAQVVSAATPKQQAAPAIAPPVMQQAPRP